MVHWLCLNGCKSPRELTRGVPEQLHLTPLTQTVQLRPDLTYLDRITSRSKARARSGHDDDEDGSDEEDAAQGPADKKSAAAKKAAGMAEGSRAVQVSIKDSEGGAGGGAKGVATGRQDGSLFAPLRAEEAEEWTQLDVHPPTDDACTPVWEALFARSDGRLECQSRATDQFPKP